MTCEECQAVIARVMDALGSELMAVFRHFDSCPACNSKMLAARARVSEGARRQADVIAQSLLVPRVVKHILTDPEAK